VEQLTFTNAFNATRKWSPDGTQIAFESDRDGDSEIYVMNADGSNVRQLTDNDTTERHPNWRP
jgi:Tol biopolymer transport system component